MNVRGFVEGVEAGSRIGAPIAQAYQQRALMALRQKEIDHAKQQTALENEFRKLQMLQAYDPSTRASQVASNFPEDYRAAVFMDEIAKRQKEYDMMRQQLGALGDKSQIEIDRPEEGVKAKISVRDAAMLAMNPKTSKFVQPALQSLSQDVPRGTFGEDVSVMPEYSRLSQAEQQRRDMMLAEEQRKEGEFGLRKDELDLKRQAQGVQQSQFEQQNALERDKAVMQQTGMIPESIASAYPSLASAMQVNGDDDVNALANVAGVPINAPNPYRGLGNKKKQEVQAAFVKSMEKESLKNQEDLNSAQDAILSLDRFLELNSKNSTGGALNVPLIGGVVETSGKVFNPEFQELNSIAEDMRLKKTQILKGAITEKEQVYAKESTVNIGNSYEANIGRANMTKSLFQRVIDKNQFLQSYGDVHKTIQGAEKAWNEYITNIPVIDVKSGGRNKNYMPHESYFRLKNNGVKFNKGYAVFDSEEQLNSLSEMLPSGINVIVGKNIVEVD